MNTRISRATVAAAAVVALLLAAAPVHAEWNKGLEAYKSRDWATAVKEFEEVTKTNPEYAGGYYMLGVSQRSLGQVSPAIASLRKAVELDGSQPSYKIALGQALLQADQYQNAYELLKPLDMSAMEASVRSSYALLFAQAATQTNRPTEAINVLSTQIRADAKNSRLQVALGAAHNANGDDAKAFNAFKTAFELDPTNQSSGSNAVRSGLLAARRSSSSAEKDRYYSGAAQVAERLAASNPSFDHNMLAGEARLGAGDYRKAQEWFEKAKAQQPNNAVIYLYLAQCKTSTDQLSAAIADLQQALKVGPSAKVRSQIYTQGGYVYDKMKNYGKAIEWYQNAGNDRKVAEMRQKQGAAAQNLAAEQECAEFKRKIDALRLQVDELQKLGDMDNAKLLQEQLPTLERDYAERCR
jgi:tetratricopeptide (TPR) repeat protein